MEIYKFGGASLKNTGAIINMGQILSRFGSENLVVVVSAIGKTTNALESVFSKARVHNNFTSDLENLRAYHYNIGAELFGSDGKAKEVIDPSNVPPARKSQCLSQCRRL